MAVVREKTPGKRPRIVRDNGAQFAAKEWTEVVRHFELDEIPTVDHISATRKPY